MRNFLTICFLIAGLTAVHGQCLNRALDFDGVDDYVQAAVSSVTGNADFTAEARFTSVSTIGFRRMLGFGGANTRVEIGEMNGVLRMYLQSSDGGGAVSVPSPIIRNNGWHHLAISRAGGTITVYLDCEPIFTTTFTGTLNISNFRIGAPGVAVAGTVRWHGQIDEVRVWSGVRMANEITSACNCNLQGSEPNLQLLYNFDQSGITPVGNNTGQNIVANTAPPINNGTLLNFALSGSNSNWVCGDMTSSCSSACVADFVYFTDACGGVFFFSQTPPPPPGAPAYTYSWDFGDGSPASTDKDPDHYFPDPFSAYLVCLTVIGTNGPICTTCLPVQPAPDVEPPIANCIPNTTISIGQSGFHTINPATINNGSTDNCFICVMGVSPSMVTCAMACQGPTTVVLTAADCAGNTSTCSVQVTVQDQIAPQVSCPPNTTITGVPSPTGCTGVVDVYIDGVVDNCSPNPMTLPNVSLSGATSGAATLGTAVPLNEGTTTLTFLAVDDCGNSATCQRYVTVECIADCTCGAFRDMTIGAVGGNAGKVECDTIVSLPCPVAGQNFTLQGAFACVGNCSPTNIVWQLIRQSDNAVVGAGVAGGMPPNFSVSLSGSDMAVPGTYQMNLQAVCGGDTCRCGFELVVVDCSGPNGFPGFHCGQSIFNCFSGFTGLAVNDPVNSSRIKNDVVLAIADIRNHALAIPFTNPSQSWPDVHPLYHHPDWTSGNMGQVFGLAIDNQQNVYAAATTTYGQQPQGGLPGAGPGTIYRIDAISGTPSVWANLPNSLTANGNILSGLGDLSYDPDHNCLFASNFHDGMIYRLDMSGNVLQTFDPPLNAPAIIGQGFYDPNATAGFAPRGQRIWGIGYHNNRLYFGVWVEDHSNGNTSRDNELWSVSLNAADGAYTGMTNSNGSFFEFAQLERSFISNTSLGLSPISDIAFSCNDELVFATKTMRADYNNWTNPPFAHFSSTWKLPLSNLSGPISQYFIGVGNGINSPRTNGSGGLDIGYGSFDPTITNLPTVHDDKIWVTADAMIVDNTPNRVYGISGLPFSGNSNADVGNTSIYIDADNDPAGWGKAFFGDVEIFKCLTCPASIPPECDSISITIKQNKEAIGCCYSLSVTNAKPNHFSYIELAVLDGGDLASGSAPAAGWTLQGFSSGHALFQPAGGVPVPTGSFPLANFCLENLVSDNQTIVIRYYDPNFEVTCTDTIRLQCDACVEAAVDSTYCDGWNQFGATICIKAGEGLDPEFTYNSATIVPVGGILFTTPAPGINNLDGSVVVALPALSPGDTYCSVPVNIVGAVGGQEVCFYVIIHDGDITADEPDLFCCADTTLVCFVLPECDPCDPETTFATAVQVEPQGDLCCWQINVNNPDSYFETLAVGILTPGVTYNAVNNTIGSGWSVGALTSTNLVLEPVAPQGSFVQNGYTMPTVCFTPSNSAVELLVTWVASDQTACTDQLSLDCNASGPDCVNLVSDALVCVQPGVFQYTFTVTNNASAPAFVADHVTLHPVSGSVGDFTPQLFSQVIPNGGSATFTTNITGLTAGETLCFRAVLHESNDGDLHINCCPTEETICLTMPPCAPAISCPNNLLQDGGFLLGYQTGTNGFTNTNLPWVEYANSPQFTTTNGCASANAAQMWGNQVVGEGIFQNVNLVPGNLYRFTVCARWHSAQDSARVRIMVDNGNSAYNNCVLSDCNLIGISPILGSAWGTYTFTVPFSAPASYSRIILTPWNDFAINNGNFVSWIQVDDVCVEDIGDVPIGDQNFTVTPYPNPTTGALTLAFNRDVPEAAQVRVLDMFGRLVQTEPVPERQSRHEMHLQDLPPGVYFIEIRDQQRQLWGKRVVKE